MNTSMTANAAPTETPARLGRMRLIRAAIGWHFADAGNALMNICNSIAPEDVATTSQLVGDWYYVLHGPQDGPPAGRRRDEGGGRDPRPVGEARVCRGCVVIAR